MKKFDFTRIFFISISLLLLIIGFLIPDSNKTNLIISFIVIAALIVFDIKTPAIAKLSPDNPKVKTMKFINRSTISIFIIFVLFTILSPIESSFSSKANDIILSTIVSVLLMAFGNVAPKIPFNRYMGFRLPWTIRDEDTWKVSHKILGYISFPIAILMFIFSFFIKYEVVATTGIFFLIAIPGLYSLWFYHKKWKSFSSTK